MQRLKVSVSGSSFRQDLRRGLLGGLVVLAVVCGLTSPSAAQTQVTTVYAPTTFGSVVTTPTGTGVVVATVSSNPMADIEPPTTVPVTNPPGQAVMLASLPAAGTYADEGPFLDANGLWNMIRVANEAGAVTTSTYTVIPATGTVAQTSTVTVTTSPSASPGTGTVTTPTTSPVGNAGTTAGTVKNPDGSTVTTTITGTVATPATFKTVTTDATGKTIEVNVVVVTYFSNGGYTAVETNDTSSSPNTTQWVYNYGPNVNGSRTYTITGPTVTTPFTGMWILAGSPPPDIISEGTTFSGVIQTTK
jgi:hypothetical protein